jgi:hypothetical protein
MNHIHKEKGNENDIYLGSSHGKQGSHFIIRGSMDRIQPCSGIKAVPNIRQRSAADLRSSTTDSNMANQVPRIRSKSR